MEPDDLLGGDELGENSRNQEQFVAKHTGVGTDDLAPLSESGHHENS